MIWKPLGVLANASPSSPLASIGDRKVKKNFSELAEQELPALAIALEEEDNRNCSDPADAMRETHPGTAHAAMAEEEDGHRHVCSTSTARSSAAHPADPAAGCEGS